MYWITPFKEDMKTHANNLLHSILYYNSIATVTEKEEKPNGRIK